MIDHEVAVRHLREHAESWHEWSSAEFVSEIRYVADMADWALEAEKMLIEARSIVDDASDMMPDAECILLKVDAVLAKRPGQK